MSKGTDDTVTVVSPNQQKFFVDACGRCNVDLVGVDEKCPNCGAINRRND